MKPVIEKPFLLAAALRATAVGCVRLYQWTIRPVIGPRCRFLPHCSDYAIEAIQTHGLFSGSWLTAKRLGRCHPWCAGGFDPVPPVSAVDGAGSKKQSSVFKSFLID